MMESDDEFGKTFQMVIDNAIMYYLDGAEEHGIKISHFEDDEVYVNLKSVVDIVSRGHGIASTIGEEASVGASIVYDVVLSLAQILASRNYEVTPNDIIGVEDD